jgi:rfaE bifunctional protein kinase chain/domain
MQTLSDSALVAAFADTAVLIVGDVMLDEYVWGDVRRISQEAPVPVVEATRRTYAPGGAANVATNVAALGGRSYLGGVIGHDYSATQLRRVLDLPRVDIGGLVEDPARPTTTKTRIVAHSQQVVRVDSEQRHAIEAEQEAALLAWFEAHIANAGACVLSDYSKGVISPRVAAALLHSAQRHNKPVIVDPKGTDYAKYRGATIIKPNIHEAERAAGREIHNADDLQQVAAHLSRLLEGCAILITRGAEGMSLFAHSRTNTAPIHIPPLPRDVYDVTGAGDTVVSALALALANGAPLEQAARLANLAAGIVVGKLGTASVTAAELLHELAA